jgi:hypothetical protein
MLVTVFNDKDGVNTDSLKKEISEIPGIERLKYKPIVNTDEMGGVYVLPFGFKNERGNRTSHHLFFVSKNFKGYEIMKYIMARESSENTQGVASFQYSPASLRWPILFELSRPLDDLEEMLLDEYAGRTLTMLQIYEAHSIGKPFIKRNYKDILIKMESAGKITTDPPADKRRRYKGEVSFGDNTMVMFPARSV